MNKLPEIIARLLLGMPNNVRYTREPAYMASNDQAGRFAFCEWRFAGHRTGQNRTQFARHSVEITIYQQIISRIHDCGGNVDVYRTELEVRWADNEKVLRSLFKYLHNENLIVAHNNRIQNELTALGQTQDVIDQYKVTPKTCGLNKARVAFQGPRNSDVVHFNNGFGEIDPTFPFSTSTLTFEIWTTETNLDDGYISVENIKTRLGL